MSFLNFNKNPVAYGAIMYNGSAAGGIASCYPFFTSRTDIGALTSRSTSSSGTITIDNIDDYWTVMPGYKLLVYTNPNYTTLSLTGDNTSSVSPVTYAMNPNFNLASSIQLYYNNILINDPNPIKLTATNYATTYTLTYNSANYRVYEFQTGSTGTLSVPAGINNLNILALLIGGGGGGGNYFTAQATASAGGGAGAFVTTTINAEPGSTFSITVGQGGNGAAASTTNAGTFGSPTSISRSVGGVSDAVLTVGGGGGGGAASANTGTIGTIYGSTGGTGGRTTGGTTDARVASNAAGTAYTVTGSAFTGIYAYVSTGGNSSHTGGGGGGGGAGGTGGNASGAYPGGKGGDGLSWGVIGSSRLFAGGGGGMNSTLGGTAGAGGTGGGGAGYASATAHTGSGGGSGFSGTAGGNGGSGICIIAVLL
jgi:hypothetical protein